jgi:hypothetical protein
MKFLFNAYPKSGSKTFANVLRNVIQPIRIENDEERPELEDWVICQYEPVVNLATFSKDVIQVSVVRNPSDAITINVERMLNGFFGKQFYGIDASDKNKDILSNKTYLSHKDKSYIDHEINRYNSYIACLDENIDNIVCFTNEQIKNNTFQSTINLLAMASIDYAKLPSERFQKKIYDNIPFHPFSSIIRDYIENNPKFALGYNKVIEKIKIKQLEYPFSMDGGI